jgi:hypothetical protein
MTTHCKNIGESRTYCGCLTYELPDNDNCQYPDNQWNVTCQECIRISVREKMKRDGRFPKSVYEGLPHQPWQFIEANNLSFLEGSVIKRVCRHRAKDGAKDIDKAIDELQKLKQHLYNH